MGLRLVRVARHSCATRTYVVRPKVDGGFPKVDDDREIAGVRIASHMPYYQCDIEEHIKKVVAAGGKVIKEKYEIMGGHGFAADCQDLDGNIFALYSQK